jgi:hypothetical protein
MEVLVATGAIRGHLLSVWIERSPMLFPLLPVRVDYPLLAFCVFFLTLGIPTTLISACGLPFPLQPQCGFH